MLLRYWWPMGCSLSKVDTSSPWPSHGRQEQPDEVLAVDRYSRPASIWAALETGCVRLVKLNWLIVYAKAGKVLPRRQDLPEAAFISLQQLKSMWEKSNKRTDISRKE